MKHIITIGREFGSGGRMVGVKLSEILGISCYDEELLSLASEQSGIAPEVFKEHDEKPINSFLYSLAMHGGAMGVNGYTGRYVEMPMNQKVFLAIFNTIQNLADQGPCIIVGRCGDYALRSYENVVRVFIHGEMDDKVKRICEVYGLTKDQALTQIAKIDKMRASHYDYYSDRKWGAAKTYDLTLNSTLLGIDGCVDMILHLLKLEGEEL